MKRACAEEVGVRQGIDKSGGWITWVVSYIQRIFDFVFCACRIEQGWF